MEAADKPGRIWSPIWHKHNEPLHCPPLSQSPTGAIYLHTYMVAIAEALYHVAI